MASHEPPWLSGLKRERSVPSVLEKDSPPDIGITKKTSGSSSRSLLPPKRQRIVAASSSSTPEFLPKNKKKQETSNVRSISSHEFPNHDKLFVDVASGLNFKRKGLLSLLDLVEAGSVSQVVVSYKDRLARFGTDLIERTIKKHGATLHMVSHAEDPGIHALDDSKELADDLLAVCNFFVARNNGRRAAALRRGRQSREFEDPQDPQETSSPSESDEDSPPPPKRGRPRKTV